MTSDEHVSGPAPSGRNDDVDWRILDIALSGSTSLNTRAGGLAALTGITLGLTVNFSSLWLSPELQLAESARHALLYCLLAAVVAFAAAVAIALFAASPGRNLAVELKKAGVELRDAAHANEDEWLAAVSDLRPKLLTATVLQQAANDDKAKRTKLAYVVFLSACSQSRRKQS